MDSLFHYIAFFIALPQPDMVISVEHERQCNFWFDMV